MQKITGNVSAEITRVFLTSPEELRKIADRFDASQTERGEHVLITAARGLTFLYVPEPKGTTL